MKKMIPFCALALLTGFWLTGCASVNPLGSNIKGVVVMPDGTPARDVDLIVSFKRVGIVGGSEGIGDKESDRRIRCRNGSFKTHFVGLSGIMGVRAYKPGYESDFIDLRGTESRPPRDLVIQLHPTSRAPEPPR